MPYFCQRTYDIAVRDAQGVFQFVIQGEYLARWVLKEGQPGLLALELPTQTCLQNNFTVEEFGEDYRIEIRRTTDGVKTLVGEAPFFLNRISSKQDANGNRSLYIEAEHAVGLLDRRVLPYDGNDPRADLVARACDDQMKFVVRNNFLAIAGSYITDPDAVRDLSTYLQVEADATAIVAQYEGQSQNQSALDIMERIQKYAFYNNEPLFYHLVQIDDYNNPFLEFRTYAGQRGVDRTVGTGGANAQAITPGNGAIAEYDLLYNWKSTASRMYGGGRGVGAVRTYVQADDPALAGRLAVNPFALREQFANVGSNVNQDIQVETEAQLQASIASIQLTGTLGETPVFAYGRDWLWGDKTTAFVDGVQIDVYIETEECSLERGRETLTVGFSNNLQKSLSGIGEIYQQQSRTNKAVKYLNSQDYA